MDGLGLVLWFAGALLAPALPGVAAGALALAVHGIIKRRGIARLASTVPLVSGIAILIPARHAQGLQPPLYIGGWYLFLAFYALVVVGARKGRAGRPRTAEKPDRVEHE
jgi:hypothetical protein